MSRASHLLTETITYADVSSTDGYGDPTYGTRSTAPARIDYGIFRTTSPRGEEVMCSTRVTTETAVPHRARVWLPDDNAAVANEARRITRRKKSITPDASLTIYELYLTERGGVS